MGFGFVVEVVLSLYLIVVDVFLDFDLYFHYQDYLELFAKSLVYVLERNRIVLLLVGEE